MNRDRELISYTAAARQLAETSAVSFSEAYETLLTASDAIRAAERRAAEQAWDEGWAAGQADEFDAREGREHDDTVNPYQTADPANSPQDGGEQPSPTPPEPAERHTADLTAENARLRHTLQRVRDVYDMQCPVRHDTRYVKGERGARMAHLWWQKVLGGVLSDHQDAERRAASTPAQGGYIPGESIPCTVDTLRVIEPGLSVASINGAAPEYVMMSADWIRRNAHRIQPADMRTVADWLHQTADTIERRIPANTRSEETQ